ncbi:MAG TPA: YncE family protein [Candidatus Angelobacter sp.]|nr:YncE family protein [Candidatus Angelobacter sp.]
MISSNRAVWAVLVIVIAVCVALVTGCGDTFRPTINFQPQPGGDPAAVGQAVVLATNPAGTGSNTHIDVSGDSSVGVVNVGPNPVFLGKGIGRAFVLNSDNTATLYVALLPESTTINTVTLPATTSGAIGGAASSNGNIYIANSGSNDVSVIASGQNVVTTVVPVGSQPVMVGANGSGNKAYVINHGDHSVTVIGTQDNIPEAQPIQVGAQPIWAVMSSDGVDVFVVNQGDGTVSVIDTTLDIVIATIPVGPSPNFAFYDNVRKRVYVTNTGNHTVSVIKADSINLGVTPQILPVKLADVTLSGTPISVGAIADGTRAYAALGNCPAGTNHTNLQTNLASCTGNQVSVIDAVGLFEKKVIPVGSGTVSIAPSVDGTRVYAANAHDGNISIIKTSTDSELMRVTAPQQSFGCANPSCGATGVQTPFMVLTFP